LAPSNKKSVIRVLYVDDDLCFLEVSKQILSMENNFEIDSVASVEEAFKKMKTQTYDAVVSDYEMPQKNGLDFLKELREQKNDIAFILFTGKGREEVVVKALNLGADSYLNKNGAPEAVYCELADAINKTVERKKSKQLLVESEMKYRTVVEKSHQGILITQTSPLKLVFANESMGSILGYSTEELKSLSPLGVAGLIYDEDKAVFFSRLENHIHGEPSDASLEFRAVRKNGSIVWLEAFASRIEYMGQAAVQGMFLDIDERKKVSEILRENEQRYRELANSLPNIVYESDLTGKVEFVNDRGLEIAGISNEDFEKGLNILQFLVPEDRQRAMESMERLLTGDSYVPAEYVFLRKNGTTFPALITTTLRISENKVTGLRGVVIDISERKKAEEILRQDQELLEAITDNLGAGFVIISKDYRVLYANKFVKNNCGNVEGKQCYATLNTLDHICPDCGVKKVFEDGVARDSHEYSQMGINGEPYYVELIATPLKDKDGNVTAGLEFVVDIAEKKRMQQELQAKEAKFRAISDSAIDAIFMFDEEDRIIYWNPAAARIFGYNEKEIIGEKVNMTIIPPSFRKDHLKLTSELCAVKNSKKNSGEIQEFPALRKDGSEFSMEIAMTALQLNSNRYFAAIARDTTERNKAEEVMSESQQKFKALFSANPDAAVFLDLDFHVVEANSRFSTLFGYSFDEIKGKIVTDLIVPDDSKEESRILRQKILSGSVEIVTARKRKDESQIPLFMSGGPVFVNGKVIGSVMVYKDISDIITVQEELSKALAKAELLNEKLRVLGSLSRHDVRNKLSVVTGYAYFLKKKHADQADILDGISKIEQSIKEIGTIFGFAKIYEQLGIEELTYIDVEKTLKDAISLFSGSLGLAVINYCHGLTLLADSLLRQLFYNLIDNSLKHGEKVTKIRVHYEKVDEDKLIVVYEDDGIGISVENKPHLFKEGFSTSGTSGYGLFLIRKMMEVYGWAIEENGVPGKGARFIITIPRTSQSGKESFQIT
jgi:PAS domain S-box-containing protein